MRFYGNQVCCGSYACLNAIKDRTVDVILFEISTLSPFGVKHVRNPKYDRLLTTYFDPNQGIDNALKLWGYYVSTEHVTSAREAIQALKKCLSKQCDVILGPLNMGSLAYHIIPELLMRMDHYITIEYYSESEILCTDSEGIHQLRLSYEQLQDYISVEDLPEAEGKIALRTIKKERNHDLNIILSDSLEGAYRNLYRAEESGQGSHAIYDCVAFLKEQEMFRWKLPFLYDLEYFGQRKNQTRWFLETLQKNKIISSLCAMPLQDIILRQEKLIGLVYQELRWKNRFNDKALQTVGDLERDLQNGIRNCLKRNDLL